MPRMMVWAPEVPLGPHPLTDMDSSLTFAFPVITRYPLMLQLGGLFHTCARVHMHAHTCMHADSQAIMFSLFLLVSSVWKVFLGQ